MKNRFDQVAKVIERGIADGLFPGAVAEIGDAKGSLWRFAAGQRQILPESLPMTQETVFDMASVTKVFATTMVMLSLMEEGLVTPYDHLGLFWEGLPEHSAKMTVGQLLTHSSGIPGGKSIVGYPKDTIAQAILADPLAYVPETEVQYACLGFIVLGELAEKLGGKPLDQLAQERVFTPLGMTHTGFEPDVSNIAATSLEEPVSGVVNDYNARYLARPVGNAGVFSTAEDCGIFARMLLNGGSPIISSATLRAANQNHTPYSGSARGWGFYRFNQKLQPVCENCSPTAFGHSGWTGTSVMADPEYGLYVVFLTNRTCAKSFDMNAIWRMRRYVLNAAVAAWNKI